MATGNKVGHAKGSVGVLTDIDGPSTDVGANGLGQRNQLGARVLDDNGNEYIYLKGVASLAAGDWVVYNGTTASSPFICVRAVSTPLIGAMAVAMAAVLANSWGWFQIFGLTPTTTNIATASTDGLQLYQSATVGRATSTQAATKCIFGAVAVGNAASNAGTAFVQYPYCTGNATL
jgi:hypothetical protein